MSEDHRREDDYESSMENRIVCEEYRREDNEGGMEKRIMGEENRGEDIDEGGREWMILYVLILLHI